MASVGTVEKRGKNAHFNYEYATESDLMNAVRSGLAEKRVFVLTSVEGTQRGPDVTEVHTLHTFVDGDTGETLSVKGYGQAANKVDKGGYSALTGAMKYFLMKNFLISTGDD